MIGNVILSIATLLVTLVIGLLIRSRLVKMLKKTVLDQWFIQLLGMLVVLLFLIPGAIGGLAILNSDLLNTIIKWLGLDQKNTSTLAWNVFTTFLLASLGLGLARTIRNLTIRGLSDNRVDINLRTLIGRTFYFITLTIAGFWILSIWQISLGIPVAAAGVITVAITFAIQDILKDLVAGFYLLLERPFFIGDQISVTIAPTVVYVGKVEAIELRATKLRLVGGEEISIPNAILFGNSVVNNTYYGERRSTIVVTVNQNAFSQTETIQQILHELKQIDNIIEKPEPTVMVNSYIDEKIILVVRFWIASGQIHDISTAMYALHAILPDANLEAREPGGMI